MSVDPGDAVAAGDRAAQPFADARGARWTPVFVAAVCFVAFLPTLANDFVAWDDDKNFLNNPSYRGLGASQLHWMWTTFHMGHYVPLSWMTLGLDYDLWGMDARGYHLTNLVLHAASAVVLYWITVRLLRAGFGERATGRKSAISAAAAVGVLFYAVHPLRVESVAWATERRDVLSVLFASMSFLAYLEFVAHRGRRWYAAALVLFVCGLLSKATVLTLPAIMLIVDVYPFRRIGGSAGWWSSDARRVYAELVPFGLLALGTVPLAVHALAPGAQLSIAAKIAVSAYGIAFYLLKTVLPFGLSPLYPMPHVVNPAAPVYLLSMALVAALGILLWRIRHRAPGIVAVAVAFIVALIPMLGIVQNGPQIAADRYTYHASPALAVGMAVVVFTLLLAGRSREVLTASGLGLLVLMTLTWRQTTVWHDSERFWTYVLAREPRSDLAHTVVGNMDLAAGRLDEAIANYRAAIAVDSSYVDSHDNLGIALSRRGDFESAAPEFRKALALNPASAETRNNLGIAETHLGQYEAAIAEFGAALRIDSTYADARTNWGNALVQMGRPDAAIVQYAEAARLRPSDAMARLNWGVALARTGRLSDAVGQFRVATQLDPRLEDAQRYLNEATAMLERQTAGHR